MTTQYSFFNKLFEENERAKHLYTKYDFSKYSKEKTTFLDRLSLLSKYKPYLKKFLLRKNRKNTEKVFYIDIYSASLTYSEHIQYSVLQETNETNFVNTMYIIGGMNLFMFLYFIAKKPVNQPLMKEMGISFGLSLLVGFAYFKYHRINYSMQLDEIYTSLERRLNHDPEMKKMGQNVNYLTEFNYDEEQEDRI